MRCIEHRARDFQGWRPDIHIERLRTQRYGPGGHYVHYYDWSGGSRDADRVSTFMVYVDADCEGGGTEFPRLTMPDVENGRWCEFLECGEEVDGDDLKKVKNGITFKPIKGNAVFWENMRADGRGDENTWHAGRSRLLKIHSSSAALLIHAMPSIQRSHTATLRHLVLF